MKTHYLLIAPLLAALLTASRALGADPAKGDDEAERVNVDGIREKYWARGEESEIGVVQNRTYSKDRKLEFGIFGGVLSSDPFLNTQSTGFSLGYHFSEYLSAHLLGWKAFVQPSSALLTFQNELHATTNNNPQRAYLGGEGSASLIYGKLSLMGAAIVYYDLHGLGGAGATATDNGVFFTPHLGIGQQIYVHDAIALRLDYRLMVFNEAVIEKVIPSQLGDRLPDRLVWNHSVTLGISFLLGGGPKR